MRRDEIYFTRKREIIALFNMEKINVMYFYNFYLPSLMSESRTDNFAETNLCEKKNHIFHPKNEFSLNSKKKFQCT
jgi:hypothetical protein